jgi:DNA end-binding protein Ku
MFFEKPYFVEPQKKAEKSYALLYEAMKRANKVGIAQVVISRKQHMAALMVNGPVLILELLRFAHELKSPEKVVDTSKARLSPAEVKMAEQLVAAMSGKWNPKEFRDTYQEDLKALINKKIKTGKTGRLNLPEEKRTAAQPIADVVDFMSLLQKSLRKQSQGHRKSS